MKKQLLKHRGFGRFKDEYFISPEQMEAIKEIRKGGKPKRSMLKVYESYIVAQMKAYLAAVAGVEDRTDFDHNLARFLEDYTV